MGTKWRKRYAEKKPPPISNEDKDSLRVVLAYWAAKQIPTDEKARILLREYDEELADKVQDGHGLTVQQVWDFLFLLGTEQEQVHRFRKLRKRFLVEFQEYLRQVPIWIQDEWKEESKPGQWPPEWIKKDKGIMENLNRKGCQYFFPLVELLWNSRMRYQESRALCEEKGWQPLDDVLFQRDERRIVKKLGIKASTVRHYMLELKRHGIIVQKGKRGEKGEGAFVYAMGKWTLKGRVPKPDKFLKNTAEWKRALREFDPNFSAKTQS